MSKRAKRKQPQIDVFEFSGFKAMATSNWTSDVYLVKMEVWDEEGRPCNDQDISDCEPYQLWCESIIEVARWTGKVAIIWDPFEGFAMIKDKNPNNPWTRIMIRTTCETLKISAFRLLASKVKKIQPNQAFVIS